MGVLLIAAMLIGIGIARLGYSWSDYVVFIVAMACIISLLLAGHRALMYHLNRTSLVD